MNLSRLTIVSISALLLAFVFAATLAAQTPIDPSTQPAASAPVTPDFVGSLATIGGVIAATGALSELIKRWLQNTKAGAVLPNPVIVAVVGVMLTLAANLIFKNLAGNPLQLLANVLAAVFIPAGGYSMLDGLSSTPETSKISREGSSAALGGRIAPLILLGFVLSMSLGMVGCKNFGKTTYENDRAAIAHQIGVEYGALAVSMDAFTVAAQLGQVSNADLVTFRDTKNRILTVLNEASDSVEANNITDARAKMALVSQLAATIDLLVGKYPAAKNAKEKSNASSSSRSNPASESSGDGQRREVRGWSGSRPVYAAGDHGGRSAGRHALGSSADERQERRLRLVCGVDHQRHSEAGVSDAWVWRANLSQIAA